MVDSPGPESGRGEQVSGKGRRRLGLVKGKTGSGSGGNGSYGVCGWSIKISGSKYEERDGIGWKSWNCSVRNGTTKERVELEKLELFCWKWKDKGMGGIWKSWNCSARNGTTKEWVETGKAGIVLLDMEQ